MISGKIVEALKISQIEAPISNSEYNATIEFATATNLRLNKQFFDQPPDKSKSILNNKKDVKSRANL